MVDAAKRAPDVLVAFAGEPLDASPVMIPRDAWLELVTVGEGGIDALAARRRIERVKLTDG